jgi:outer membrane protein assembly factor BamB
VFICVHLWLFRIFTAKPQDVLALARPFGFSLPAQPMKQSLLCPLLFSAFAWGALLPAARAADQPQWGQAWSRNMVSEETGLPDSFDPQTGRNILWSAELGTETHSSPVVAAGRVYIGTNNGHPRDPAQQGDRGVLMCFDEKTGRFLWQLAFPKRDEDIYFDWPNSGISSPVTVEAGRVYFVNNRGVVLCVEPPPVTAESGTNTTPSPTVPKTIWQFDLPTEAGIWSHDAAHSSILIRGDHLYLNTGTGVDNTHRRIRTPDAPSLVVLDKHTGRLLARDNEHIAPNIFHSTWSAPSMATVNGRPLVFFAAGNGIVYAFEPLPNEVIGDIQSTQQSTNPSIHLPIFLGKVWQFDFDPGAPKTNVHRYNSNRHESPSDFFGMPVFHNNRLYVAGGGDIWWGKNEAWLKCIDTTRTGDITTNSLVWSYPLQKHVLSTPAVYHGLVFIADCGHTLHCVEADTGKPYWTHELQGEAWASPLAADGKVYLGTRSGSFCIFGASKEKKLLSTIDLGRPISSTAVAANGSLYVATMTHLYAVRQGAGGR